ncbi:MAG: 6-bladed beta-propeller [Bacteroidaceae bacterium]|nr:6-bladed beta-propeller [Bacteroidaceae bacterium]
MSKRLSISLFRAVLPAFALMLVLLAVGCKGNKKVCYDCLHEINVPILEDDPTEYPLVSRLFGSIDTIYLENSGPDSYVQSVDDVKFKGDTIIVRSNETLFFFNRQGEYLGRFCRQGNGSGNYRTIARFDIQPSTGELIIFDNQSSALVIYGFDGTYHRKVPMADYVTDFAVLPNGDFLLTNPIHYRGKEYRRGLWQVDRNGRFRKQIVTYDENFLHVSINNPYLNHISPDVIGFMGVEDNDLFYHLEDDSLSVTCRMTTDVVIPDDIKNNDKVFINPQMEYTKCGYLETERFLYFVATNYGANLVMVLVNKDDWSFYRMYPYSDIFNYNAVNVEQFPYLVSCYNGTMVGFFDAGMVFQEERFQKMFPRMKEDSNPVLILYNDK